MSFVNYKLFFNYRLGIIKLLEKTAVVFIKNHDDIHKNCLYEKMRKILLDKTEDCNFFVIDLGKNEIMYKPWIYDITMKGN